MKRLTRQEKKRILIDLALGVILGCAMALILAMSGKLGPSGQTELAGGETVEVRGETGTEEDLSEQETGEEEERLVETMGTERPAEVCETGESGSELPDAQEVRSEEADPGRGRKGSGRGLNEAQERETAEMTAEVLPDPTTEAAASAAVPEPELPTEQIEASPELPAPACEDIVASQSPEETAGSGPVQGSTLYSVNGSVMPADLQIYLANALSARGIGWFLPYALLIAYQESRYDIYAVSPNGRDQGLFQYRTEYYPGLNPFDPYQEIDLFVSQMAARAAAGCTTAEMISRHMMSDYGEYYQVYVDQVMQWEATLKRV